ncbi:hypothetical protein [Nocardioides mangrovicus]|uniref:hypothetical protein n=1 Tax=Nocardioides mangrovicus TaxID=2478913 RepID=UPI0013146CA6|nr:hypothetical protein [Nocardioides mangrovicus]
MWNLIAVSLFFLLFTTVVTVLERVHRHDDLPRAPFGVDAGRDADLRRVLHDLDARP